MLILIIGIPLLYLSGRYCFRSFKNARVQYREMRFQQKRAKAAAAHLAAVRAANAAAANRR